MAEKPDKKAENTDNKAEQLSLFDNRRVCTCLIMWDDTDMKCYCPEDK